jgi:hypothetical protein
MQVRLAAALVVLGAMALPSASLAQGTDLVSIIAGIGNSSFLDGVFQANDTSSVRVVRLSSFAGASRSAERLHRAESLKASDIAYLQGQLSLNSLARTAIRNSGVTLDQIVSIEVDGHGAAVIYADDL